MGWGEAVVALWGGLDDKDQPERDLDSSYLKH